MCSPWGSCLGLTRKARSCFGGAPELHHTATVQTPRILASRVLGKHLVSTPHQKCCLGVRLRQAPEPGVGRHGTMAGCATFPPCKPWAQAPCVSSPHLPRGKKDIACIVDRFEGSIAQASRPTLPVSPIRTKEKCFVGLQAQPLRILQRFILADTHATAQQGWQRGALP